jgi:hypothetical protein
MAFANTSYSDIIATTIESRSRKIADNVLKNNALLARLNQRGNIKTVSGGSVILEELSFQQNGNGGWYSGYDLLPVAAQDVISAAQFNFKQLAVPVIISGLEQLQNSGREAMIDLMEARIGVAESTMANLLAQGVYGDGTGSGGKTLTGLDAAVETTATASQTSTYGGISRSTWAFWRNYSSGSITLPTAANIQQTMNATWAKLVRGSDRPDIIIADNNYWAIYMASLQAIQRFTDPDSAKLGFPSIKFMDADVVLDGGIGGFIYTNSTTGGTMFFLNTKYLRLRPHKDRNMVSLSPNRRYAVNQDAEVQILAWAGNLTCNGAQFQGRIFTT